MADQRDDEIAELKARLATIEAQRSEPAPPPPPQAAPPRRNAGCAIASVVGLLLLVAFCSQLGSPDAPRTSTASGWQPPSGFDLVSTGRGRSVGVAWDEPTDAECRGSGTTCFAINVISEADCPRNLYVSITLLGEGGDNIGWTNDTAQGVQAGERTRLVFDTYERGVTSARIAEVNCY